MQKTWKRVPVAIAGGLVVALAGPPAAQAQEGGRIDGIERQLRTLQQELARLRREQAAREAETRAARQEAEHARVEAHEAKTQAANPSAVQAAAKQAVEEASAGAGRVTFPGNRPTFTSPDGRFQASLGARLHYDVGGYIRGPRSTPDPRGVPSLDTFGENLRRGRIYLSFRYDDLTLNVTPDFGGSPDGNVSLYEANLNWSPIRPLTISIGQLKPLLTLADVTSSNDFLFLERPAISAIATGISAGSSRSAVGARWADDNFHASAYLTGNSFGSNTTTQGVPDQTGGVARFATRPFKNTDTDVHIGISGSYAFNIRRTTSGQTLTLNDRPGELRIDNSARLINTGALNADTAYVWSPEFALRWRNFFLQGEYTRIGVDQAEARGQLRPGLEFDGGYVEASWVLTGETRRYNPTNAAFIRPNPAHPFSLKDGTWGAWELSARYSVADLNSNVTRGRSQASTGGVFGGRQELYGVGLSWYPNNNLRFLLNWDIVNVDRLNAAGTTQIGQRFHTVALRTQINF